MKYTAYNIEDCLEILVGVKQHPARFELELSDVNFLKSLARQTSRGIALTDRQYATAKEKLINYKDQFEDNGLHGFEACLDNLRMPLRSLDRSRWIKLVDNNDWKKIAVRFVFNKKLIKKFDHLKNEIRSHRYDSLDKTHFFNFNEVNLFKIMSALDGCDFEIDSELTQYYEILIEMNNNKQNYIPGIYKFKLKNLSSKAIDYMISSIGEPDNQTLPLYKDRSELFGLHYFDEEELQNSIKDLSQLTKKIISRSMTQVLIDNTVYNVDKIVESVVELHRFPLLVILPEKDPLNDLSKIYNHFNGIVASEDSTVLFRLDNDDHGSRFNQFIKDNNLNNPLAENTKIVYINNNKIPKPILKTNWQPSAALLMGSQRLNIKITGYVETLDLVMHYDSNPSPFYRANKIEKL